jgi:DNA recombination protein RmuC
MLNADGPILPLAAALAVALVAALAAVAFLLVRRRPQAPGPDPGLVLLQQQVSELGTRLGDLATRLVETSSTVPRDVAQTVNTLVGQVGARLSENAQAVQKVGSDTGRLLADLTLKLGEIGKSSEQILTLSRDVRGLQQVFEAPKRRGAMGELALKALLEETFPAEHVLTQYEFKNGERVDAVVRLPGGLVPIDSKFPLAAFRAGLEAQGEEARQRAARAFARDVRKHIDDIAQKYIRPAEGTLDFALMYIPAESVFYDVIVQEAAGDEERLSDYAVRRRVIPVSPNSLFAYLQAIASGLMGLRIEQRARDILRGLQQVQGDIEQFQTSFDLGQKHLRNAQVAFSESGDRLARLSVQVGQFSRDLDEVPSAASEGPRPIERVRA